MKNKLLAMISIGAILCSMTGFAFTGQKTETTASITANLAGVDTIAIEGGVGNITITEGDVSEMTVAAEIIVAGKDVAVTKSIADKIRITTKIEDNTLTLAAVEKSTSTKIWSWVDKNYSNMKDSYTVTIHYAIVLPPSSVGNISVEANVGDFTCTGVNASVTGKLNVGNIGLEDCNGAYNLKANVGDIQIISGSLTGQSTAKLNVGNIKIDNPDLSLASSLEAAANIGDIELLLENANAQIDIKAPGKKIETLTKGLGTTKITLAANIGTIRHTVK